MHAISQVSIIFQYPKQANKTISRFFNFANNLLVAHFSDDITISYQCFLKFDHATKLNHSISRFPKIDHHFRQFRN